VTSTLGMLGFTALGFFLLLKQLDPTPTISLDTDWFYRKASAGVLPLVQGPLARLETGFVGRIYEVLMRWLVFGAAKLLRELDSRVIDAAAVGVGWFTQSASQFLRSTASGNTQHYGLIMVAGALVLVILTWVTIAR